MKLFSAFQTDVGKVRASNQDTFYENPEKAFFLIADGMGGHQGGEVASALAREVISQHMESFLQTQTPPSLLVLKEAFQKANQAIYEKAQEEESLQGMGTTATALWIQEDRAWIGQIGDSRCYLFLPQGWWQLTEDHSLVQEKVRAGLLSREQARTDEMKNILTRSLGFEPHVKGDFYEKFFSQEEECFLLCSDGLSGLVPEEEMWNIVKSYTFEKRDLKKTCQALIDSANQKGGMDNITVGIVLWSQA